MISLGKVDVASLEVKVTVKVLSLVVAPSLTALEPSVAVMVIVGTIVGPVELASCNLVGQLGVRESVGGHIDRGRTC